MVHPEVPDGVTGVVQWQAWQRRELPPVETLRTDLWSIPIPIPGSPLRYVTSYAFATPSGIVLIDSGWDSEQSWAALTAGLASFGGSVADVAGVLVTHFHFDHAGQAARIRTESGAWVAMHPADAEVIARPSMQSAQVAIENEGRWLRSLGAPPDEVAAILPTPEQMAPFLATARPDRMLHHGDVVDLGGTALRVLHTPGHTAGHVCFHDERVGALFAGDHLLPRITPNISVQFDEQDPLGAYLRSLDEVRDLPAEEVLPAHEWRYRDHAARVDELKEHHRHRLDELWTLLEKDPGSVPWELAAGMTWSRPWDQYEGRMRVFAVTETAAHLHRLVGEGRASVSTATGDPVPRYSAR